MSNNFISSDMIRGHIDTIILLSLVNGDKHTNEIRDEIENKAGGQYKVKQGTFYSALQRLSKHGLVSEYRSSTADSIRRKYLHLTEKGLEYVNKNIDEWNYSKNVINNMISDDSPIDETPTIKSFPIENAESEFDNLLNQTQDLGDFDLKEENNEDLDDYFKQINQTLQSEMEKLNQTTLVLEENFENSEIETDNTFDNESFDDISNEELEQNEPSYEEIIENVDKQFIDNTEEIVVETEQEFESLEDNIDQKGQLSQESEEYSDIIQTPQTEEFELEKEVVLETNTDFIEEPTTEIIKESTAEIENIEQIEDVTLQETEENVVDNSYVNDELLFGNEKKEIYSQLLDKLFPDREPEITQPQQEQIISNVVNEENADPYFEQISEFEDLVTNENDFVEPEIIERETVFNESPAFNYSIKKQTYDNTVKFDYSDIVEYAHQEGFTVRTSYSTNKAEIGKVLINKLKLHSAWLFFFTMIIELLMICFVFKTNFGLNSTFYIATGIVFLFLPIIYTINYLTDKNKAIQNISTFRNSLEIVFIICLNLILLVSAFAIISDINFSSIVDLLRYIVLPILLIINIPLYFIYKYLLLQKSYYYTK